MKKNQIGFLVLLLLLLFFACDSGSDKSTINENIIQLKACCQGEVIGGHYLMAVWKEGQVYTVGPLRELGISKDFELAYDSVFQRFLTWKEGRPWSYISTNDSKDKLLFVATYYGDISMGELYELDRSTLEPRLVRDSTYNVSSAVYFPGDDNQLVYYSYGKSVVGQKAGYYLYDLLSGEDSLLVEHLSPLGPSEMLNGFDLSPDGTRLLIPVVEATEQQLLPPKIVEYNLHNHIADTLAVSFDPSFRRIGLWLRYSPDGSQILYCNFPHGVYTPTTNDDSEVGIIDLSSRTKRILDVNTNPTGTQRSVQLAPTWSSDGRHIIYGSGFLSIEGARSTFSLYIFKNVN